MKGIRVLIVDDHTIVRQAFRSRLSREEDIQIVGEADNGRQAVLLARKLTPDVVLMDIAMPLMNGLEATRQILKLLPTCKVLVVTMYADEESAQQMRAAGAMGYVTKQSSAAELVKAIRGVSRGKPWFGPPLARQLRNPGRGVSTSDQPVRNSGDLSSREAEVLQLIAEGFLNKQIAAELSISIKTVEKYRNNIMMKLRVHNTAGLTRYAISRGIVERHPRIE